MDELFSIEQKFNYKLKQMCILYVPKNISAFAGYENELSGPK